MPNKTRLINCLPAVTQTLNERSNNNPEIEARSRQAVTALGRSPMKKLVPVVAATGALALAACWALIEHTSDDADGDQIESSVPDMPPDLLAFLDPPYSERLSKGESDSTFEWILGERPPEGAVFLGGVHSTPAGDWLIELRYRVLPNVGTQIVRRFKKEWERNYGYELDPSGFISAGSNWVRLHGPDDDTTLRFDPETLVLSISEEDG